MGVTVRQGAPRFWTSKMVYIETACVCVWAYWRGNGRERKRRRRYMVGFRGALTPSTPSGCGVCQIMIQAKTKFSLCVQYIHMYTCLLGRESRKVETSNFASANVALLCAPYIPGLDPPPPPSSLKSTWVVRSCPWLCLSARTSALRPSKWGLVPFLYGGGGGGGVFVRGRPAIPPPLPSVKFLPDTSAAAAAAAAAKGGAAARRRHLCNNNSGSGSFRPSLGAARKRFCVVGENIS